MRLPLLTICLSAAFSLARVAYAQLPADMASAADEAYSAKNWRDAEQKYSVLASQESDNARYWYRLGISARENKHYAVALDAFQRARAHGAGRGLPAFQADYEIATTYAGMGDSVRALETLKASAQAGFRTPSRLQDDAEWAFLRSSDQFAVIAKEVQHNAAPCEDAEFKQFDFWIGDWDVVSAADGTHRGSSHISREMNGCVIWENWTSAGSPYFGKSYNTWNPNLKRWEQYWVDTSAGVMFFHGQLKDKVMDYWTDDVPQAGGGTLLRHLQFFNLGPGKVRQFSQGSTDGGHTWHTEYDLIYNRLSSKAADTTAANQ